MIEITYDSLLTNGYAITNPVLERKTWTDKANRHKEAQLLHADMHLASGEKHLLQVWGANAVRGNDFLR